MAQPFLSFIIPTYNSGRHIEKVLNAILKQNYSLNKIELIIIDDNSSDSTVKEVNKFRKVLSTLKIIVKDRKIPKGAATSTNIGVKLAKGQFVCLVDSDAILANNWINEILPKFIDKKVGMVAGLIKTANPKNIWAAFAGRELEDRYHVLKGDEVDHLSTCNTVYRRELFKKIGLFNTDLYYGYDVDFSYRVRKAGYKIILAKETYCLHYWKETLKDYLKQAKNTGLARLKILSKYPNKKVGGKISGWNLVFQVPLTLVVTLFLIISLFFHSAIWLFGLFISLLLLSQIPQTTRIIRENKDLRFIFFPLVLIMRNLVWVWVFMMYNLQRSNLKDKYYEEY